MGCTRTVIYFLLQCIVLAADVEIWQKMFLKIFTMMNKFLIIQSFHNAKIELISIKFILENSN